MYVVPFSYYKYFNWNQNAEQILLEDVKAAHCWKRNILICNVWLQENSRRWSTHIALNTLQSFSHVPRIQRLIWPHPLMIQWCNWIPGEGAYGPGVYWDCIIGNDTFTNLPRLEKMAAGMLADKLTATILHLGKDGSVTKLSQLWRNIKRICSLFQAQEVAIQNGVGGPEIVFGLWC